VYQKYLQKVKTDANRSGTGKFAPISPSRGVVIEPWNVSALATLVLAVQVAKNCAKGGGGTGGSDEI
jgi:hypothetical protein